MIASGMAMAFGVLLATVPATAALAALPLVLTGMMTGYLLAGALDIRFVTGQLGDVAIRDGLLKATAAWQLAAALGAVAAAALAAALALNGTFAPNGARRATNMVLPGRRARRAGVGAPPSG